MSESNRHTLTVTESNVQLTLLSGPVGATGAAGPNDITSATSSDSTGVISLSHLNTATLTTTGTATIGGVATLSAAATIAGAATLSGGATITGNTSIDGNLTFGDASDSLAGRIVLGAGSDLQIFHNGTDSYIDDAGAGDLNIRGSARVNLQKYSGETFVSCLEDSSVTLYHDNVVKLTTTASGVNVSGVIQHSVYTVATLTAAIGPSFIAAGMRAFVSDSANTLATRHGQTVAGGGANFVPVFYDGTNWIVG
jgi:hypothetical protein